MVSMVNFIKEEDFTDHEETCATHKVKYERSESTGRPTHKTIGVISLIICVSPIHNYL